MNNPKPTAWLDPEEAAQVIEAFTPTIYQECESTYDFLVKMSDAPTCQYDPFPPLYYAVRGNEDTLYIIYGFYHRYDPVAMHNHDFEGAIIEVDRKAYEEYKETGWCWNFVGLNMTIAHLNFVWYLNADGKYRIDAGGHAVHQHDETRNGYNELEYRYFTPVNMALFTPDEWAKIEAMFGEPVKTPMRWVDPVMNNWVNQKHPVINGKVYRSTRELCWNQPEILFEIARRIGNHES